MNADNATSNDTQMAKLSKLDNSFEADNRVRCFNHTMQLAAKALLWPLNPGISGKDNNESGEDDDDCPPLILNDEENEAEDETEDEAEDGVGSHDNAMDDPDDEIDELQMLDDMEKEAMLDGTLTVRDAITKVSHYTTSGRDS